VDEELTNDVHVLALDRAGNIWLVLVPGTVEEEDFKRMVEEQTGLSVCGIGYLATLSQLKQVAKLCAEPSPTSVVHVHPSVRTSALKRTSTRLCTAPTRTYSPAGTGRLRRPRQGRRSLTAAERRVPRPCRGPCDPAIRECYRCPQD
jgi:hypothetical protein